jgi:hypothetical protein
MIDTNSLWIGDKLLIKTTGQVGTFEGIDNTKSLKIKYLGKIHHHSPSEVEVYVEAESMPEVIFEESEIKKPSTGKSLLQNLKEIDLHIEKLNPNFKNGPVETILDYQLKMAEEFIKKSIDRKYFKVTIIHGKGEGKLMTLIHQMLDSFAEVKMKVTINKDGATEVWLNY